MLKTLFSSTTRVKIISHFVVNPKESYYIRELARLLDESVTPLRRELTKLEKIGLLTVRRAGKEKYYSLNVRFPIYPELKAIVLKTLGVAQTLRQRLERIGKISCAFIYGSYAKGEEQVASDIDLMIIGKANLEELHSAIRKAETDMRREVNYFIFDEGEMAQRKARKDDFILDVLRGEKIWLIGGEDELQRIIS